MTKTDATIRSRCRAHESRHTPHLDGGWGWVVCGGAFVVHFLTVGQQNVAGVVYSELVDEFGSNRAETAWVTALASSVMYLFAPLTTFVCQRWGGRKAVIVGGCITAFALLCCSFAKKLFPLYVTYGVMWGIGASFGLFPSLIMLTKYFHVRLSLVTGISLSGAAVGTLAYGPLIQLMSSRFGVPNMFRLLAALNVFMIFSGLLYRPLTMENKYLSYVDRAQERRKMDWTIFKNKAYLIWMASLSTFMLVFMVPFVHLVRLAEDMNMGKTESSFLSGYMAAGTLCGSLLFGKLSEARYCNRLNLCQFALLSIGVSSTLVTLAKSYEWLAIYAFTFGLFDGCYEMLVPVITNDIVGVRQTPSAIGTLYFVISLPKTVGPPVAGWVYDTSNSYVMAFYVIGAVSTISALLMFLIPVLLDKEQRKKGSLSSGSSASDMKPLKDSEASSFSEIAQSKEKAKEKATPGLFTCYMMPYKCFNSTPESHDFHGLSPEELLVAERETCV